jgi:hypothetical protein
MKPSLGTLTANGLYTAPFPGVISSPQIVTITATSVADPTKSAVAAVTLDPVATTPSGDFDGNGVPDILIQNDSTRQVGLYYMGGSGGASIINFGWIRSDGIPGWSVVGVGDFNRDGVPDIIIENDSTRQIAVYFMGGVGGSQIQGFAWIRSDGVPGWSVKAVGDLNQDGVPDIIVQDDATRQIAVYYMGGAQGNQVTSFGWISANGVPGWSVVAAADMNRDGVPDVIIQNDTTRQIAVYYMGGPGGSQITRFAWIRSDGVPGWSVSGAADQNGDGVPDVIIQSDTTRQIAIYYMGGSDGSQITGFGWIRSDGIPGWRALAPYAIERLSRTGRPTLVRASACLRRICP